MKTPGPQNPLAALFPENSKLLLTGSGREFVERLGVEAIRQATLAILCGDNLRLQTEPLTRRRIALVSGALVHLFARGWTELPNFSEKVTEWAAQQITTRGSGKADRWLAQWILGLTGSRCRTSCAATTKDSLATSLILIQPHAKQRRSASNNTERLIFGRE